MSNLIPTGTAATAFADGEVIVTTSPKVMLVIGDAAEAEFEVALKGSDDQYYPIASMSMEEIKEEGVLGVPGTWAIRRVFAREGDAGLDILG